MTTQLPIVRVVDIAYVGVRRSGIARSVSFYPTICTQQIRIIQIQVVDAVVVRAVHQNIVSGNIRTGVVV